MLKEINRIKLIFEEYIFVKEWFSGKIFMLFYGYEVNINIICILLKLCCNFFDIVIYIMGEEEVCYEKIVYFEVVVNLEEDYLL